MTLLDGLVYDTRHAFRQLRKTPGFTAVAVGVLALGVGANTAMFSVVDAVLLRPLPYPDADRLVWVGETVKNNTADQVTLTPDFLDWRKQNHVFTAMAAFNPYTRTLTGAGEPLQLHTVKASAALLPILKIQPVLGRNFLESEDQKGRDSVALLSYGLWRRNFGGRGNIVGRSITLDEHPVIVVGVLPPEFEFPSAQTVDLITPLGKNTAAELRRGDGVTANHDVIARLKPDVTLEQARAEMTVIESRLAPPAFMPKAQLSVRVLPLRERLVGNMHGVLIALMCAVGFLLLLACANVANLLLSRAISRRHEMAVRSALGASRRRLAQQLFVECLALAVLGCISGVALAFCARRILLTLIPRVMPGLHSLPINFRVLGFAAAGACVSTLIFGLGPALSGSRSSAGSETRASTAGARPQRWLNLLASAQMAIAIVLLTGGVLMLQSFWNLRYRNLGFQPEHVLTVRLQISRTRYPAGPKFVSYFNELLENIGSLPGINGVASGPFPPGSGHATNSFNIEGRPREADGHRPVAQQYAVSPEYFRLLQIPLLSGRVLRDSDTAAAPPIVLVNQALARRYFPGESPIGKKIRAFSKDAPWRAIAGVVGDIKTAGLAAEPEPAIYFPYRQTGTTLDFSTGIYGGILIRTPLDPASIAAEVRKRVARLDPSQPVAEMQTMDRRLTESVSGPRLATILLGCFATLGLLLAAIGLYGVMAFLARSRMREIGIRLAIGAKPRDIRRMILARSLGVILAGIAAGSVAALWLDRFLRGLLYGVSPGDPATFALAIAFLTATGLAAAFRPAHEASKIDPIITLRLE